MPVANGLAQIKGGSEEEPGLLYRPQRIHLGCCSH